MVDWISLAIPFAYLGLLIGSMATFSHLYRTRKASRAASLAPWFGPHTTRNIYLSLLHLDQQKVPDSVLKAALLRRAVEDIHRIVEIRNAKAALQSLLQRGSVGDDLWQRFQRAEKEIEAELRDVVQEANAFSPGWGQSIFQNASEVAQNQLLKQRVDELQAQTAIEKAWWEKKRGNIRADFMKELDEGSSSGAQAKGSDDDGVLVESASHSRPSTAGSAISGASSKKKGKGKK
ncbi:translocation protein-like protein sec66 [Macrophomina phaseolina]|uniref:Translocation protein-like protein sec66 n=1 Tax=Macrophomina phaseolina TaxID=35725 RepID=A0ABQ8FTY5_9PEZI|nr:translocation protein-like protein sec66 [Macrophomina phaseolina]